MNDDTGSYSPFRWLVGAAIAWLLVAGLLVLQLWPDLPSDKQGWALFLTLGPPLYIAGEACCGWLFSPSRGWAISRKRFSPLRIALALPVALAWFALVWWFASLIK
jgi:hypothetical protein